MLSIIVAAAENNVIGKDNQLIWRLPDDMKYFKEKTYGHCVITGRKNYESIPTKFRPLEGRTNIIVTRKEEYEAPGALVARGLHEAIETAGDTGDGEIFIIGGSEIYNQSIHLTDRIYLTRVHQQFEGDAFFPALNPSDWKLISSQFHDKDEKHNLAFTFEIYDRN